jgi:hypothetical protein
MRARPARPPTAALGRDADPPSPTAEPPALGASPRPVPVPDSGSLPHHRTPTPNAHTDMRASLLLDEAGASVMTNLTPKTLTPRRPRGWVLRLLVGADYVTALLLFSLLSITWWVGRVAPRPVWPPSLHSQ